MAKAAKTKNKASRASGGAPGTADQTQILAVAARLFREKGYHGSSMQDIADRMGLLKGSLYYYIRGKDELLHTLLEKSVSTLLREVREAAASGKTPEEKLRSVIRTEIVCMADHQDEIMIWLAERDRGHSTLQGIARGAHEADMILKGVIDEGVKAGIWRKDRVALGFRAILGMLTAFPTWYDRNGPNTVETIADQFAFFATRILSDDKSR